MMLVLVLTAHIAIGQDDEGKPAPPLPKDKNLWLNSSPYTLEQLRGKGVYLFAFTCTSEAADFFPEALKAAKQHSQDPIVFIGVSMGSDRATTDQFLKTMNCNWPTFCDPTRAFVRECDAACDNTDPDSAVALRREYGSLGITAKGRMTKFSDSPEDNAAEWIKEAAWTTDPKEIPEPLLPLWRSVEFRKYSDALPLFKKGLATGPESQKEAAKKLKEVVTAEIERLAGEAREADEKDDKWEAYSKASKVIDEFRGYDIPKDLDVLQKKLAKLPQVKAGIAAEKQLPNIAQSLASPNAGVRKRGQSQAEKIIADFPDSDLAASAQRLLDTVKPAPK